MPYGQLIFWFITYTAIIAGTAISALAAARYGRRPFRIILFTEISLLFMVLSVSLVIFAYYQKAFETESRYYQLFQFTFFLGLTASSFSFLFIPAAVFPGSGDRKAPPLLAFPIFPLFILYGGGQFLRATPLFLSSPIDLITGLLQLALFLSFMASSIYALTSLVLSWQPRHRSLKAIMFSLGLLIIVAVFLIDILYGLWSKLHFQRDLSIFHVLPAYALIVSTLLTVFTLSSTTRKMDSSARIDPALLKSCAISPREEEVIHLLINGEGYKDIADKLCISLATVQTHIRNIYRKTDVNSKVELINLLRGDHPRS